MYKPLQKQLTIKKSPSFIQSIIQKSLKCIIKNINYNAGEIISEYHLSRDYSGSTEFHKKNGMLDGKWIRRYANGDIAEQGNYKNGLKQGEWVGWYKINRKQCCKNSNTKCN